METEAKPPSLRDEIAIEIDRIETDIQKKEAELDKLLSLLNTKEWVQVLPRKKDQVFLPYQYKLPWGRRGFFERLFRPEFPQY